MSGCLAISTFDNKPSKLHNQLIKIFGDDDSGFEAASAEYEFLKTDSFKNDVGFDWQELEMIDYQGNRTKITQDEAIKQKYINEQGEPLIVFQQKLPAYQRTDGSLKFFDSQPLNNFTEGEIKELVGYSIYVAMGKIQGIQNLDFESSINADIKGSFEEGSDFYNYLKEDMYMNKADIEALKQRVYEQLSSIRIKLEDNDDIQKRLDDENDADTKAGLEIKDGNSVVKVESFTINSKNTASANVKTLLSFIPEVESYSINEDGSFKFKFKEGDLTPVKFKDMDKVWGKIEENVSNIFTKNINGEVESVLSQMMDILHNLGKTDPTIMYVYANLKSDRFDSYKKTQFAQAFLKQRLLYYTSEVDGKPGSINYKFFDAGAATSKERKFKDFWEIGFSVSPYFTKDVEKEKVYYSVNQGKIKEDIKKVSSILSKLRTMSKSGEKTLNAEQKQTLESLLERVGIPAQSLDESILNTVLKRVNDESGQSTYTETKAVGILLNSYIKPVLDILLKTESKSINSKSGDFKSPIKSNKLTTLFAEETAKLNDDFSENTIMGANNKMMWSFSLPTYIDITAHAFKNGFIQNENGEWYNPYINQLRSLNYNKNSKWLEWLSIKENADKFAAITFSSMQSSKEGNEAVDNKDIQFFDQLNDQLHKYLNEIKPSERSIFYSPTPADKGRLFAFIGPDMVQSTYNVNTENGNAVISKNSNSIIQLAGYFEDEYLRMTELWNTVTSKEDKENTNDLYIHYHINAKTGKIVNEQGVPIGNGFKSQLIPELSWDYKESDPDNPTEIELRAREIRDKLYNAENKFKPVGITDNLNDKIRYLIALIVSERTKQLVREFGERGVFEINREKNTVKNLSIDKTIWNEYLKAAVNTDKRNKNIETAIKIVGDYVINGIVANIEYSKVFAGDIAYYKDSIDYNKRIPATYTDGKYLADINNEKELTFKVAVTKPIEFAAKKLYKDVNNPKDNTMEEHFIYSLSERAKFMDESIRPSQQEIEAQAKALTAQYENVNAADAQGWITLERWKFLKTKLDGWSPKLENAYQQMLAGDFSYENIKLAAQPLKGVYFNRDAKTGVPTYLKYSQMVLIPGMWKGTTLENLSEIMNEQKIDEVITLDGVKSGALSPTQIHNEDGSIKAKKDIQFNTYQLSNLHWKLQQQLPVKAMKDNMDLGSQIMKNVLSNIIPTEVYGKMDGKELTGRDVIEMVHSTISELTDIAFNETINMLGTKEDGTIKHKNKLYKELANQLQSKNMPSFIIEAIKRGYSLDAIPQVRYKAQNVISAMINNNIAKTITPGASMIQMSNVGVTKIDTNNTDPKNGGIFMLKNIKDLNRPEINIRRNSDTGKVEKATVYSGQVFLPHSFIAKYIPNYQSLSREELLEKIDKRLLNIIGYRIPNQKMSSIQPLEIVGILPPSMGDAIMMYSEITTQTGSDFDIDKTYIMMPEYIYDEKTGSLKYINSKPNKEGKQSKKQLRNQLFELYNILLKSPLNYADMQSGIDGNYLKNLIKSTHKRKEEAKKMTGLKLVDPFYQLQIKFANSAGKSGVGLTANQMVDHILTQIHDTVLIDKNIGIGNIRDRSQDLSGIYDTQGKTITDTISMFLNAFVDIAKDPYITDGNFNEVTSNIVFFMIRSGVPLDFIVKYIGQPSFESVTEKVINSKSLVTNDRPISVDRAIDSTIKEIEEKIKNVVNTMNKTDVEDVKKEAFKRYGDISKIKLTHLQENIDNTNDNDLLYLLSQLYLLRSLSFINETSQPLTELVLGSKADVNGGGPDIATHITNLSRYNKITENMYDGGAPIFTGIEERFAPNTMLGSKTRRTLEYLNRLDEQLFISANEGYKSIYTYLSYLRRGSDYILDSKFLQDVEKQVYAQAMFDLLSMTDTYSIKDSDLESMFDPKSNMSIANRVIRLQKQDDLKDNDLIQNLEIKQIKGFKFVSLDNFKNKPSSSLDNIQRGWKALFENDKYKAFATDLVKYAYVTSGFSRNRNSIYEVIPLNVSDDINRQMNKYKDLNSLENFVGNKFIENLYRSPFGEQLVPTLSKDFSLIKPLYTFKQIEAMTPGNSLMISKFKELGLKAQNVIFVPVNDRNRDENADDGGDTIIAMNKIKTGPIIAKKTYIEDFGETITTMYKNEGIVTIGNNEYHLLSQTHKLGLNEPGLKIYENGDKKEESFIKSNNPSNYNGIKNFVEWVKENAIVSEEFKSIEIKKIHETKNVIKPSFEAVENLTRRGIMDRKCD